MRNFIAALIFFLPALSCFTQSPADSDKDGIPDSEDACPFQKGTKTNKGCPEENAGNASNSSSYCRYITAMKEASLKNFMDAIDVTRPIVKGPGNTNHNYNSSIRLENYNQTLIGFNGGDREINYKDAPYCFSICTMSFNSKSDAQNEFNRIVKELESCMEVSYPPYHDDNDCKECGNSRAYFKLKKLKDINEHNYDLECRFFLKQKNGTYTIDFEVLKPIGGNNFTNTTIKNQSSTGLPVTENEKEILEIKIALEFFDITEDAVNIDGSYSKFKKGSPVKLEKEDVYDITQNLKLPELIKANLYIANKTEGTTGIVAEIPSKITRYYIEALKKMTKSQDSNEEIGEVIISKENGYTRYKYKNKMLGASLIVISDYDNANQNDVIGFLSVF